MIKTYGEWIDYVNGLTLRKSDPIFDVLESWKADALHRLDCEEALHEELAALREANRWIPVGERLPDGGEDLVMATNGNSVVEARYYFYAGVLRKHGWYQPDGSILGVGWATHWRNKPAPPPAA